MDVKKLLDAGFTEEKKQLQNDEDKYLKSQSFATDTFIKNGDSYLKKIETKKSIYKTQADSARKLCVTRLTKQAQYDKAKKLYDDQKYYDAYYAFATILDFSNSRELSNLCAKELDKVYDSAFDKYNSGKYSEAKDIFRTLIPYRDSKQMVSNCDVAISAEEAARKQAEKEALRKKQEEEKARLDAIALELYKKKLKKNAIIMIITCIILTLGVGVFSFFLFTNVKPSAFLHGSMFIFALWTAAVLVLLCFYFYAIQSIKKKDDVPEFFKNSLMLGACFVVLNAFVFFSIHVHSTYSGDVLIHDKLWLLMLWMLAAAVVLAGFLTFVFVAKHDNIDLLISSFIGSIISCVIIALFATYTIFLFFNHEPGLLVKEHIWLLAGWMASSIITLSAIIGIVMLALKNDAGDQLKYYFAVLISGVGIAIVLSLVVTFSIFVFGSNPGKILVTSKLWLLMLWMFAVTAFITIVIGVITAFKSDFDTGTIFNVTLISFIIGMVAACEVTYAIYLFGNAAPQGLILTSRLWAFALWIISIMVIVCVVGLFISDFDSDAIIPAIGLSAIAALLTVDVLLGVATFANKAGISALSPSGKIADFNTCVTLWVFITIATIVVIIFYLVNAFHDEETGVLIWTYIGLGVAALSGIIGFIHNGKLGNSGNPANAITVRATSKSYSVIYFDVSNDSVYDISKFTGKMEFYNKSGSKIAGYDVYFSGDYYAHSSHSTSVDFGDKYSSLVNASLSNLKITYRIYSMIFGNSYSETSVNGKTKTICDYGNKSLVYIGSYTFSKEEQELAVAY